MKKRCLRLWLVLFLLWKANDALPQQKEGPDIFIDKGACPFECCTYGSWEVKRATKAHASPDIHSSQIGEFKVGSKVEAITGEVHTVPKKFVVKKTHKKYVPGDVIWVYTYLGEGVFKVQFKSKISEEDLGFSPYGGTGGTRCQTSKYCWGELEEELSSTWWIQIKSADGWVGWTNEGENFGGKDACG